VAKIIEDGKRVKYSSYEEYVKIQDSRYHDYDCPNCLKMNMKLIDIIRKMGIDFKHILDIGCRDAAYFDKMKKQQISCTGVDISPRSVKYALSKGRNVSIGDAVNLSSLFKERFDLIISCHSFEHLLKPEKVLKECYKVLTKDGHLAIRMPNEGDKIRNTTTKAHARAYTEKDLRRIFGSTKFSILKLEIIPSNEFIAILKK
tara:strand:- start:391 stop:996 length:606 start_codon:yes stop_codon:yes gene_type:complete